MFIIWYDDSPKTPVAVKIRHGIEAYVDRYGMQPATVLVNAGEREGIEVPGVEIQTAPYVRRNNYYIGQKEA